MMRLNVKKAVVVGAVCLVLWVAFTYVSFTNSPLGARPEREERESSAEKALLAKVAALERQMNAELESNKDMLLEIKRRLVEGREGARGDVLNGEDDTNIERASKKLAIPVLVLACNRITVKRCLDQLLKYRPDKDLFPIIISQDCNHEQTRDVILTYVTPDSGVTLVQQPDLSDIPVPPREKKFRGYFHIARHYKFALDYTFKTRGYEAAIIVEDDLDIAPDFFEYFLGTYPLLLKDPTLWCVSAWNDNGKAGLVDPAAASLLHRSDFFPGLGWMLTHRLWDELQPKWPSSYWDDWIRKPEQRLDRACIRPELPRTRTFGKVGVSNGLFFDKHLKLIELSQQSIAFTKEDLSHLLKDTYDTSFGSAVYAAPVMELRELKAAAVATETPPPTVRINYAGKEDYKRTAKALGLMDDFRSGVGRTAYKGVVTCFFRGRRVYIAPEPPFEKYDPAWS